MPAASNRPQAKPDRTDFFDAGFQALLRAREQASASAREQTHEQTLAETVLKARVVDPNAR